MAERKPWERAWKNRKRRRSRTAGGGEVQEPPQKRRQETKTIQKIVELTDAGFEGASIGDWGSFISALKVVKVDRMREVL